MTADILKKVLASTWHIPSLKELKAVITQSKEEQDEIRERIEKLDKRIAMLDGEDKWMSRFNGYKENR
jgi:hypothetical protein